MIILMINMSDQKSNEMRKEDVLQHISDTWNNNMPFNKLLGLEITRFNAEKSEVSFAW